MGRTDDGEEGQAAQVASGVAKARAPQARLQRRQLREDVWRRIVHLPRLCSGCDKGRAAPEAELEAQERLEELAKEATLEKSSKPSAQSGGTAKWKDFAKQELCMRTSREKAIQYASSLARWCAVGTPPEEGRLRWKAHAQLQSHFQRHVQGGSARAAHAAHALPRWPGSAAGPHTRTCLSIAYEMHTVHKLVGVKHKCTNQVHAAMQNESLLRAACTPCVIHPVTQGASL